MLPKVDEPLLPPHIDILPWGIKREADDSLINHEIINPEKTRSIMVLQEPMHIKINGIEKSGIITRVSLYALAGEDPKNLSRLSLMTYSYWSYDDGTVIKSLRMDAKTDDKSLLPFCQVEYLSTGEKTYVKNSGHGKPEWREKSDQLGINRDYGQFPPEIDFETTIKDFLSQVEEKRFDNPALVLKT